jgi:hypothetical protein
MSEARSRPPLDVINGTPPSKPLKRASLTRQTLKPRKRGGVGKHGKQSPTKRFLQPGPRNRGAVGKQGKQSPTERFLQPGPLPGHDAGGHAAAGAAVASASTCLDSRSFRHAYGAAATYAIVIYKQNREEHGMIEKCTCFVCCHF